MNKTLEEMLLDIHRYAIKSEPGELEWLENDLKKAGTTESMHYNNDWLWLMPVVEKILAEEKEPGGEPMCFRTFGMRNKETGDYMVRLEGQPLWEAPTLIEATFKAVAWYVNEPAQKGMYFRISGYWKDNKVSFEDYLVRAYDDTVEDEQLDDQIFYYGLGEKDLKEALGAEDTALEFVITQYRDVTEEIYELYEKPKK